MVMVDVTHAALDRFWDRVDRSAGPDGCWPWTGRTDRHGHGRCSIVIDGRRQRLAHRAAYIVARGWPVPDGAAVAFSHGCRTPACCNPAHIRVSRPPRTM